MTAKHIPNVFEFLLSEACVQTTDIRQTDDGFSLVYKPLSSILATKGVAYVLDKDGERVDCNRFFDDWFVYAVSTETEDTYGLLKLREQEFDARDGAPADGDTPGVTISFISFDGEALVRCLQDPDDRRRAQLNDEIDRVAARRGQRHHPALKRYFAHPRSQGAYLVAAAYVRHVVSLAKNGLVAVSERYKGFVPKNAKNAKLARLPRFIDGLNQTAGRIVCDHETICVENPQKPTEYESVAILATHTGNTSAFSFAAEVEYHARFLTPWANVRIPFLNKTLYDSAVRADMTVDDAQTAWIAPFYHARSAVVKRQYAWHRDERIWIDD